MRPFGIEIECYHPETASWTSRETLAREITRLTGAPARVANYTGRHYTDWQLKEDASLSPPGKALEVVSRILDGSVESVQEVRKVADMLDAKGYRVNRSCGLHVHLNVKDIPFRARVAVSLRWNLLQNEIKSFLPPSRYNGQNGFAMFLEGRDFNKVRNCVLRDGAEEWDHDERRVPVNLEHVTTRGTIEFRQAAGTVNADKIEYWIRFLNDFVDDTARIVKEFEERPVAPVVAQDPRLAQRVSTPAAQTTRPTFRAGSRNEYLYNIFSRRIVVAYADLASIVDPSGHGHNHMTRIQYTDTIASLRLAGLDITRMAGSAGRYTYNPFARQIAAAHAAVAPETAARPTQNSLEDMLKSPMKLSDPVAQWVRSRKAVFAEDVNAAA